MAHKVADRVRETSTTTGTGSYTLAGAVTGFQAMSAVMTSNNDTGFFFATDGVNWEVFLGTRTDATTLARTTIYASSNGGSAVNWGAGTKDIVGDVPARFCELLNTISIAVASAATCDIGAVHGSVIEITGTVTITSLGTSANKLRYVRFSGALTLTHNGTSLILPGAANITTIAGDTAIFISDGSGNWRCWYYRQASAGSFTPTLLFGGVATGVSYTTQDGKFIRDGNAVHFRLQVTATQSGASGNATIGGLPFTGQGLTPVSIWVDNFNALVNKPKQVLACVINGTTTIGLYDYDSSTGDTASMTDAFWSSTTPDVYLAGTYFI